MSTRQQPDEEWITVREAARRYPIGVKRLYRLVRGGEIKAVTIQNPVRPRLTLRPEAVEAWLLSQERLHGGSA